MLKKPEIYEFSFEALHLKPDSILSRIGYRPGLAPEPVIRILHEVFEMIGNRSGITGGYAITDDLVLQPDNFSLKLAGQVFATGKIITARLRQASQAAVFVCTAGEHLSALSGQLFRERNEVKAYIADTVASEAVENAMDRIQEALSRDMGKAQLSITNRYSPGYCGWPIEDQHALFSLLPKRFCGLTLTDSALMLPEKSVSGIIGIGKDVKHVSHKCQACEMDKCIHRKKAE